MQLVFFESTDNWLLIFGLVEAVEEWGADIKGMVELDGFVIEKGVFFGLFFLFLV